MFKLVRMVLISISMLSMLTGWDTNEVSTAQVEATDAEIVDLTQLSDTVIYSAVYDMVQNTENYLGKTVKMKGTFYAFTDPISMNDYTVCMVTDTTQCCQQGVEFKLSDVPETYPAADQEIVVTGVLTTYKENDLEYLQLSNAVAEW